MSRRYFAASIRDDVAMTFLRIYLRVLATLRPNAGIAAALVVANLVVAGLQFVDPLLFGQVIELLTRASSMSADALWREVSTTSGSEAKRPSPSVTYRDSSRRVRPRVNTSPALRSARAASVPSGAMARIVSAPCASRLAPAAASSASCAATSPGATRRSASHPNRGPSLGAINRPR